MVRAEALGKGLWRGCPDLFQSHLPGPWPRCLLAGPGCRGTGDSLWWQGAGSLIFCHTLADCLLGGDPVLGKGDTKTEEGPCPGSRELRFLMPHSAAEKKEKGRRKCPRKAPRGLWTPQSSQPAEPQCSIQKGQGVPQITSQSLLHAHSPQAAGTKHIPKGEMGDISVSQVLGRGSFEDLS